VYRLRNRNIRMCSIKACEVQQRTRSVIITRFNAAWNEVIRPRIRRGIGIDAVRTDARARCCGKERGRLIVIIIDLVCVDDCELRNKVLHSRNQETLLAWLERRREVIKNSLAVKERN